MRRSVIKLWRRCAINISKPAYLLCNQHRLCRQHARFNHLYVLARFQKLQGLESQSLHTLFPTMCPLYPADCSAECRVQDLADKIAQLNSAIDDVSSQLKSSDAVEEVSTA